MKDEKKPQDISREKRIEASIEDKAPMMRIENLFEKLAKPTTNEIARPQKPSQSTNTSTEKTGE